jgi:hypothetical protein
MPVWLFILVVAVLGGLLLWSKLTQRRLRRERKAALAAQDPGEGR